MIHYYKHQFLWDATSSEILNPATLFVFKHCMASIDAVILPFHLCLSSSQLRFWTRSGREDAANVHRTVGNHTSTVIRSLKGSTTYYVSVRAYNTAGSGPPSATINVTTKKPRKYLLKP